MYAQTENNQPLVHARGPIPAEELAKKYGLPPDRAEALAADILEEVRVSGERATGTKPCFAHRHMTIKEFGLWNYLRSVSHKSHVVQFDGRQIASQFADATKSAVYRVRDRLIKGGWLVLTRRAERLSSGHYSSAEYKALSHEEWRQRNPGACEALTCPSSGTGDDMYKEAAALFGPSARPVPFSGCDQSHLTSEPVPPVGHNLNNLSISKVRRKGASGQPRALPSNFEANPSNRLYAQMQGIDIDPVVLQFRELHGAIGNRRKNWQAVLRRHLTNIVEGLTPEPGKEYAA